MAIGSRKIKLAKYLFLIGDLNMKPLSIKIFLSQGDPSGIRTAQMSMSTILAIAFKANQFPEVKNQFKELLNSPGVYVLIGTNDEGFQAYIGESEDVAGRLAIHSKSKGKENAVNEFWDETVVLISKDENLTKSHVRYVESRLLSSNFDTSRWSIRNGNRASADAGRLPIESKAEMNEFIEQGKILIGILGWDVFRDPKNISDSSFEQVYDVANTQQTEKLVFSCKGKTHDAKMVVAPNGDCIVQKGSKARLEIAKSTREALQAQRKALMDDNLLNREGDVLVFTSNYAFKSPSNAASVVSGANVNGHTSWVLPDGKTTYGMWRAEGAEKS